MESVGANYEIATQANIPIERVSHMPFQAWRES